MGTRTTTVVTPATTARVTRSKKAKPIEVEEKHEDNDEDEIRNPVLSFSSRQSIEETDTATPSRAAEPTRDAATEPYDDASDDMQEPMEAEIQNLERAVKWLNTATTKLDVGRGATASNRVQQLAVDLQRLTTKLVERQEPALGEDAPSTTRHVEYEDAEALALHDSDDGGRVWRHGNPDDGDQDETTPSRSYRKKRNPVKQKRGRSHERRSNENEDAERRPRRRERSRERQRSQGCRGRDERDRQERRGHRHREHGPRRVVPDPDPSDENESASDDSSLDGQWNGSGDSGDSDSSSSSSRASSSDRGSDAGREDRVARRRARRSPRRERRNESRERRKRRGHRKRREQRYHKEPRRRQRTRNIKDLELPSFTPTPRASVSTWVDRIDLALKGAKESGRGEWSDRSLYFILGNKLMESAARWWVNMDRRLHYRDRTWTKLKVALLRRYGPRVDKSAAEARVNARFRLKDEPYADFAAGLREAADRNEVSERVFLAQFYRCLDRTVRQLVKQPPAPTTLEEAVEKAVEIDDPMDYVMGNQQLNQTSHVLPSGDGSRVVVIPGVGTLALPTDGTDHAVEGDTTPTGAPAVCTNQQGVYNWPAGVYELPPGQKWNGRFWAAPEKTGKKRLGKKKTTLKTKPDARPAKMKKASKRVVPDSSSEDEEKEPSKKRYKTGTTTTTAAAKMVSSDERPYGATRMVETQQSSYGDRGRGDVPNRPCYHCGQRTHWSTQCPNEPKCYACHQRGHFARDCTDPDAKKRNEEYRKRKAEDIKKTAENESRA